MGFLLRVGPGYPISYRRGGLLGRGEGECAFVVRRGERARRRKGEDAGIEVVDAGGVTDDLGEAGGGRKCFSGFRAGIILREGMVKPRSKIRHFGKGKAPSVRWTLPTGG
jgi:hypothetical protein